MAKQYVVSACLAGEPCRYDGGCSPCPAVQRLIRAGQALPVAQEKFAVAAQQRAPALQKLALQSARRKSGTGASSPRTERT